MNFLETIFRHLKETGPQPVLREIRDGRFISMTAEGLLAVVAQARRFVRARGLTKGDRAVILAPNSVRWVALDLALMAEGIVVVPLFVRESADRLAAIIRDCRPALICADAAQVTHLSRGLAAGPRTVGSLVASEEPPTIGPAETDQPALCTLEDIFASQPWGAQSVSSETGTEPPQDDTWSVSGLSVEGSVPLEPHDPVTIIYTSGTSGEPKGVVLTVGNVTFMLPQTNARLDRLMKRRASAFAVEGGQKHKEEAGSPGHREGESRPDQVFHYLPFCFAGSWILLLTCLSRSSVLTLSTDLTRLGEEIIAAQPDYFLNVPTLLERMKAGIEVELRKRGQLFWTLYQQGAAAWWRLREAEPGSRRPTRGPKYRSHSWRDVVIYRLARRLIFSRVRKKLGPQLRALICGSAPLREETQRFFLMLGLPVLQVYGLTETTAICTMDDPDDFLPGWVGPAISGIEMRLGPQDEILVRGPHVFAGYWNRPEATAEAFTDGWFRTGDQGDVNEQGKWRIIGRVKNLIVLSSGHNVAPEPIELMVEYALASVAATESERGGASAGSAQMAQAMVVGHGRPHLGVIVTGEWTPDQVAAALERVNAELPSFKRIRTFHISPTPFTPDNGLLTANGKLRRQEIERRFRQEIERMYG